MRKKNKEMPVQVKASLWFLICSFLQKGISTVTTPIFTRLMSASEYGQYGVFHSWLGIVSIFVTLSLSGGVYTQGLIKFDKSREVFSSSLQGLTFILVAAWTCVYLFFQKFWNAMFSLTTVQVSVMMLMIWTSSTFSFWCAKQRVEYKYKALVIVTLFVSLAKPILSVFFIIYANDKVTARILGMALSEAIGYSWCFFVQLKQGGKWYVKEFWKYAILYNLPLIPHYLSQIVLTSADRIMIQNMVGASEAGIYSLAYSLAMVMILLNTAIAQTLSPWIYQKIKDQQWKQISPVAYATMIVIAVANLILMLFVPEVVALFAPREYYEAIWCIPPVAMSVFYLYCYDLFVKFAFYYEKTNFIMAASLFGAVLNLILNYFCIRLFGYLAAGYTTLVCYMVYSFCHYYFMKKVCKLYGGGQCPYSGKRILLISCLFMCCGFFILATYRYTLIRYGIFILTVALFCIFRRKILPIWRTFTCLGSNA